MNMLTIDLVRVFSVSYKKLPASKKGIVKLIPVIALAILFLYILIYFGPVAFGTDFNSSCSNGTYYWDNNTECNITSNLSCQNSVIYYLNPINVSNGAVLNFSNMTLMSTYSGTGLECGAGSECLFKNSVLRGNDSEYMMDHNFYGFLYMENINMSSGIPNVFYNNLYIFGNSTMQNVSIAPPVWAQSDSPNWIRISGSSFDYLSLWYNDGIVNFTGPTNVSWYYLRPDSHIYGYYNSLNTQTFEAGRTAERHFPICLYTNDGYQHVLDGCNITLWYGGSSIDSALTSSDGCVNLSGNFNDTNAESAHSLRANGTEYKNITFFTNSTDFNMAGNIAGILVPNVTVCGYPENTPPQYNLSAPQNESLGENLTVYLRLYVYDVDDGSLNVTFINTDTSEILCQNTSVPTYSYVSCNWSDIPFGTYRNWSANITDGKNITTTLTYNFRTKNNITINSSSDQISNLAYNLSLKTTVNISVTGNPINITLNWTNFSSTNLSANKTSWTNFNGSDTIEINITRSPGETKSRIFYLYFNTDEPGIESNYTRIITKVQTHPSLLFNDINETPGYRYNQSEPWNTWQSSIISSANTYLTCNFSDPNMPEGSRLIYRSAYARYLAFAYQITKNMSYFEKAKEALLNLDVGDAPYLFDKSNGLRSYSFAYDWIQPQLDITNETIIRNKLAVLADTVYGDLNTNGTDMNYITFADYHGQAYPDIGVGALVLYDFTDSQGTLSSTPEDWLDVATDYLFINDQLHSYNRSLLSVGFDEYSGKHLAGAYKAYTIPSFTEWFQSYSHFFNESIFENYTSASKIVESDLWETLPNHYVSNYITSGNELWLYQKGLLNIFDNESRAYILRHVEAAEDSNILPNSASILMTSDDILYSFYENYSSAEKGYPNWTSHLDKNAVFQVFRGGWQNDSDWLSLVTFDSSSRSLSNRDNGHPDQLGFEYYSRGDLILADAGEDKYVMDAYYGDYEVHHNTISFEDPRNPFNISSWSNSRQRGIHKGGVWGIDTPANNTIAIQQPWMDFFESKANVSNIVDYQWLTYTELSSPVNYSRAVLYPNNDYFIIFDGMDGNETWIYRNIFRPTSLNITPTYQNYNSTVLQINSSSNNVTHAISMDTWNGSSFELRLIVSELFDYGNISVYVNGNYAGNLSITANTTYTIRDLSVSNLSHGNNIVNYTSTDSTDFKITYTYITVFGNVLGNLSVENTSYDWLSLKYKNETQTGINTSNVKWNTTNPYGNITHTRIFSVPSSEILVTKHLGRIAGYSLASEVFNPVVYFRSNETERIRRITVLLTSYDSEYEKIPEEISTTGNGSAIKVMSENYTDYIYFGNGNSAFGNYSTNSEKLFVRYSGTVRNLTMIGGSSLNESDQIYLLANQSFVYIIMNYSSDGNNITIKSDANSTINSTFKVSCYPLSTVKRDNITLSYGTDYGCVNSSYMWVSMQHGSEHTFEIFGDGGEDETPPTMSNIGVNSTSIYANQSVRFNATVTDDVNVSEVKFAIQTPYGNLNITAENVSSHYFVICNQTNECNTSMIGQYNLTSVWANDTNNNIAANNSPMVNFIVNETSSYLLPLINSTQTITLQNDTSEHIYDDWHYSIIPNRTHGSCGTKGITFQQTTGRNVSAIDMWSLSNISNTSEILDAQFCIYQHGNGLPSGASLNISLWWVYNYPIYNFTNASGSYEWKEGNGCQEDRTDNSYRYEIRPSAGSYNATPLDSKIVPYDSSNNTWYCWNATGAVREVVKNYTNITFFMNATNESSTAPTIDQQVTYRTKEQSYTVGTDPIFNITIRTTTPAIQIELVEPVDNETITTTTKNFSFIYSGSNQTAACRIVMNNVDMGSNNMSGHNSTTNITVDNLSENTYSWHVNCSINGTWSNVSETRTLEVIPYVYGFHLNKNESVISLNATNNNSKSIILTFNGNLTDFNITPSSNYSDTSCTVNTTSQNNVNGSFSINFTCNRTSNENLSRIFLFNVTTNTSEYGNKTIRIETRIKAYPNLLFSNYSQTPSYKYNSSQWSTWKNWVNQDRNSSTYYASGAFDYYITGSTIGLNNSKLRINSFTRTAGDGRNINRVYELEELMLAYDLTQPYLNESEDISARDKIAEISDQIYHDLNHIDTVNFTNDMQCVDYHFRAVSVLGMTGILLSDYTNYSLPHSSNASEWERIGTEVLFVKDDIHTINNNSMFSYCIDTEGIDLVAGDYRSYYTGYLFRLAQIYSRHRTNMLDKYPILLKWVMAPVYYYMPNKYDTNRIAGGHVKYGDGQWWINLLNSSNQQILWKYYYELASDNELPESRTFSSVSDISSSDIPALVFIENYTNISYSIPDETDMFGNHTYQVFRNGWSNTSQWMNFVTWKQGGTENRFMIHNDQLSFELYDKGDYLLADSGEVKYLRTGYGPTFSKGHNVLMFNDTLNGNMSGFFKGLYSGSNLILYANATIYYIDRDRITSVEANISSRYIEITNSTGASISNMPINVSSDLKYKRTIIRVAGYFVILDKFDNNVSRGFDLILNPSSFNFSRTNSTTEIGNLSLNMSVNGTYVDWRNQQFEFVNWTTNTSNITFNTTSLYGDSLQTQIYSVPTAEVGVEKYWSRMGGFDIDNEVYSPKLHLRNTIEGDYYRLTLINVVNSSSESPLDITEYNNSLKITNGSWVHYVSHGNGTQIFGNISTDANYSWSGNEYGNWTIFMRSGSNYAISNISYVKINSSVDYALINWSGSNVSGLVSGNETINLTIYTGSCLNKTVEVDGSPVSSTCNGTHINFSMPLGSEHNFEIFGDGMGESPSISLNSPSNGNVTTNQTVIFNCSASDEGNLVNITLFGNWSGSWHANETKAIGGSSNSTTFTKIIADGNYSWNCMANDSDGNSSFSASNYTFIIDSTPPPGISGLSNQSQGATWIYWTWTNPGGDFNHSEIWINGTWKSNITDNYYNATGLMVGSSYEIQIITVDNIGNTNSTWVNSSANTTQDITSPVISAISVNSTSIYANQSVRFNATVTDDVNVSSVRFAIQTPYGNLNITAENVSSHYFIICNSSNTCRTNMTSQYNLTSVWANDTSGNNQTNQTTMRNFTSSYTPPVLTAISPSNTTYAGDSIMANVSVDKAASRCILTLNSTLNRTMTNASSTSWYLNISVATGSNNLKFWCNDSIGTWGNTSVIYFYVNSTGGTSTTTTTSSGSSGGGSPVLTTTTVRTTTTTIQSRNITFNITKGVNHTLQNLGEDIILRQITIIPNSNAYNITIKIQKIVSKPVNIPTNPAPVDRVYVYLEINLTNVSGQSINFSIIKFSVEKTWLSTNNYSKNRVWLNRYSSGAWTKLNTTIKSENSTHYTYDALTPGFSIFAVTAEPETALSTTTTTLIPDNTTSTGTGSGEDNTFIIIAGILFVAALISTAYIMIKRRAANGGNEEKRVEKKKNLPPAPVPAPFHRLRHYLPITETSRKVLEVPKTLEKIPLATNIPGTIVLKKEGPNIFRNFGKDTGLEQVSIDVNRDVDNVRIRAIKLPQKPSLIKNNADGIVYKYIEIGTDNLYSWAISSVSIQFKVEKSWLNSRGLDKKKVILNRHCGGDWMKLTTKMVKEDSESITYEATSRGFFTFAITAEYPSIPKGS